MVCSKKRLGKADATRVGIEEIQICSKNSFVLAEITSSMRDGVKSLLESGSSEGTDWNVCPTEDRGTLADSGAEVTPVAHEEERGYGFERVQQTKHPIWRSLTEKGK